MKNDYLRLCKYFIILISAYLLSYFFCDFYLPNYKDILPPIFSALVAFSLAFIKHKESNQFSLAKSDFNISHYAERKEEADLWDELLSNSAKVFSLYGISGIGKTLSLAKIQYDINYNKRIINSTAYYFIINNDNIKFSFSNQLALSENISIEDLFVFLRKKSSHRTIYILLDFNLDNYIYLNEFIHIVLQCDLNVKFVIATRNKIKNYFPILLKHFCEQDVITLSKKLNVELSQNQVLELLDVTEGLPVFIAYLIKDIANGNLRKIDISECTDIEQYIEHKINTLASDPFQALLIISYCAYYDAMLNIPFLKANFDIITDKNIAILERNAFLTYYNESTLHFKNTIGQIIRKHNDKHRFKINETIYNAYRKKNKKASLFFLICSKADFESTDILKEFENLFNDKEYYYLTNTYEKTHKIGTWNVNADDKLLDYFIYIYVSSLLELGEYTKAREFIESDKFDDMRYTLDNDNSNTYAFKMNYLIADLYHLICEYEHALTNLVLMSSINDVDNKYKCLWLEGHIYRHMGKFDLALPRFEMISKQKCEINDVKIVVKSMYSIISIQNYKYESEEAIQLLFNKLDEYLIEKGCEDKYSCSINRHKAIFMNRIQNKPHDALDLLLQTVSELKKTNERIIYDYYFELAEIYRILSVHKNDDNFQSSKKYYEKAKIFSENIQDKNLYENVLMGIFLLDYDEKESYESRMKKLEKIQEIISPDRLINYDNFYIIKNYVMSFDLDRNVVISEESNCKGDTSMNNDIRKFQLTVM